MTLQPFELPLLLFIRIFYCNLNCDRNAWIFPLNPNLIKPLHQQPTFAISLVFVFSDTARKNRQEGKTNAIKVPIVAPVKAKTNSTITQKNTKIITIHFPPHFFFRATEEVNQCRLQVTAPLPSLYRHCTRPQSYIPVFTFAMQSSLFKKYP